MSLGISNAIETHWVSVTTSFCLGKFFHSFFLPSFPQDLISKIKPEIIYNNRKCLTIPNKMIRVQMSSHWVSVTNLLLPWKTFSFPFSLEICHRISSAKSSHKSFILIEKVFDNPKQNFKPSKLVFIVPFKPVCK